MQKDCWKSNPDGVWAKKTMDLGGTDIGKKVDELGETRRVGRKDTRPGGGGTPGSASMQTVKPSGYPGEGEHVVKSARS